MRSKPIMHIGARVSCGSGIRKKALEEQLKQHEQRATEKQTHQTHIRDTHKQTFDLKQHPYFSFFLWGVAMLLLFLLHPRKQK